MAGRESAQKRQVGLAPRVWTRVYILLCGTVALAYAHEGLLTPVLPLYLSSLGHSEATIGLVLAAFSLSSFVVRPFVGYWADRWSVLGVLGLGLLALGCSGLALMVPLLGVVALANAGRGVGWAALNTGSNAALALLAPPARRGEAASYYNLFQSGTASLVPAVALWLLGLPGVTYASVILVAAGAALAASLLVRAIPPSVIRRHQEGHPEGGAPSGGGGRRFVDRNVLLPSLLLALMMVGHSATKAFVPLFASQIGIAKEEVAWYFLAMGVTALVGRLAFARLSDRVGRGFALVSGCILALGGLLSLATATGLPVLLLGGVLFALGEAIQVPTTTALAIDLGDPRRPGTAMASYSLAFQIGLGLGAALNGVVSDLAGYRTMYLVTIAVVGMALGIIMFKWETISGYRLGMR